VTIFIVFLVFVLLSSTSNLFFLLVEVLNLGIIKIKVRNQEQRPEQVKFINN
jgi:hypothetical protein